MPNEKPMTSASGRSDNADHAAMDDQDGGPALRVYRRAAARPTATWPMPANSGGGGLLLQHVFEDRDRLLHLVHRPVRDAAVRLLERREVARDEHAPGAARVAELLRGTSDVDEHEVGLRVGRLHAAIGEPLH